MDTAVGDQVPEGILLGMGNPLLDISNTVEESYLAKYGLKCNDAILAEEKHMSIFAELQARPDTEYIPGGATQNAVRVAQWILRKPGACGMFGCVKNDECGQRLKDSMTEVGVRTAYQINKGSEGTGKCAVLIMGEHRSLVTELASANCFTVEHLDDPANWAMVESAKFYYVAGFFLTVCPPALMRIAEHSVASGKTLVTNLSAPFLCQFFKEPMMAAMPYVDVLFGNETEAETFANEHGFSEPTDMRKVAEQLSALPKKDSKRPRLVLITQGKGPVVVAMGDQVTEYSVPPLNPEQIVDTNGAGDAFVGGFLAQFVLGKSMSVCVDCGIRAAHCIIGRSSCTFPSDPSVIGY